MEKVSISALVTPNPNTLKFVVDRMIIQSGTVDFSYFDKAKGSKLPEALFDIQGITGVMVGPNFVSVSKSMDTDWASLASPITDVIQNVLQTQGPYINLELTQKSAADLSDLERRIQDVLDNEIRPAIAMDGGDIEFIGFVDGVVTLHLQGACSSCPSSTMTLKFGIENRLKEEFPEVTEVVQL